jgi:hypothetical protein
MANTIKQKRGTSDPGASDLVVGELAINTTDGGVFTKTDGGSVVEVGSGGGGGGASAINDLSDAVTYDSGVSVGLGTGALTNSSGTDQNNTALGYNAGLDITSGSTNVVLGYTAGRDITTANGNIAIGNALNNSAGVTGNFNVAISADSSGRKLTSGNNNVFIGTETGKNMTTGASNVFIGDNAGSGSSVTATTNNVFIGRGAGASNTGSSGVCLGNRAGDSVTGNSNTIIGNEAQYQVSLSGTNNLILGANADASTTSVSNEITLGDSNITTLRCNVQTISSLSDGRDKINVAQLGEGLNFISRLKPVKFEWKTRDGNSKDGTYEAGFIAQDLQQAQQDGDAEYLNLVMDSNPDRLEASYGKLVPVLVRAIQELKAEIDTLKANGIS